MMADEAMPPRTCWWCAGPLSKRQKRYCSRSCTASGQNNAKARLKRLLSQK